MKTVSRICFFSIIVMLLISFIPLNTKEVKATSTLLTITNGKSYVSYTCVYENKFIVINDTYILEYNLDTLALDNSYNLGGSVAVSDTLLKGQQLYIKYIDGGVTTYGCFDIPSFTLLNYQADSKFTTFNGELKDLAYLEDIGINYWCWITYSTGASFRTPNGYVFPTLDSTKQYKRFGIFTTVGFNGFPTAWYLDQYVYNETADSCGYLRITITSSATYESWSTNARLKTDYTQDGHTETKVYTGAGDYYMSDSSEQLQQIINDADNNSYVTYAYYGMREDTFTATSTNAEGNALKYVFMDTENTWNRISSGAVNKLEIASFVKGSFGAVSTITLSHNTYIVTQQKGVASIGKYYDYGGTLCTYIAYVDASKNAYAEKIIGSTATVKGSYTPSASSIYVYAGDKNFIVAYTLAATNHLYVYTALLPSSEIGGYGQTLIAQLYRCHVSSGTFLHYIKFMQNNTYYTPLSSESYKYYLDGVYQSTGTLDTNGMISAGYYASSFPHTLSYLVNKTGYTPKWFNITLYSISPLSLSVTDLETPILGLSITDSNSTNTLLIDTTIKRFTGESLTSYYWINNPKIRIKVEIIGLNSYYYTYTIPDFDVVNGLVESSLAYSVGYSYRVTYTYDNTLQNGILDNLTNYQEIMFSFDSASHIITIGGYVNLPTVTGSGSATPPYSSGDLPLLTTELLSNLTVWAIPLFIILTVSFAIAEMFSLAHASTGLILLGFITGLNIGVGICTYIGFIPFYMMTIIFVLDAILFYAMLKSGGNNST